ncbi:MAG: ATP-binding protein [Pedobacter sp.]|uniref:tetratricopeptide repeat-containing sensor histidine kinase n=1 Tax=Pedobacter sp. TaxID=1411316 RepID=UPI0028079EEC|nr:ATP-binding protein [Pedobacter sp.]MDQ8004948.1 ATP-binding protein [Pedobacter sp.]
MKAYFLLLLCFVLSVSNVSAQWKDDYEKGKWLDSLRKAYYFDKSSRPAIGKVLKQKLQQQKDGELQAFVELIEFTGRIDRDPASVDSFYEQIEKKYKAYPNIQAMCYQNIGYYYFMVAVNYEKAFGAYLKLEKLLEVYPANVITNYANYCAEISSAFYKFKDYKKAIELGKRGVDYASNQWDFYNTIGLSFMEQHQIDSAIHYLQKAVDVAVEKKMLNVYRTISLGNIGYGYYRKKEYEKAKPLIIIDLNEALKTQDYGLASGAEIPLADIYLTEQKWAAANVLLDSARHHIALSRQLKRLEKFFPVRSRYYQLTGNQKLALAYRDSTIKAIKQNDSIFNSLLLMRVQQRTDLEKLVEEKAKLESYKKVSQIRMIAVIVVFVILLIVILVVRYYRGRIEKDRKRIEELNRIMALRQKLSADMHDDIGSTLSSISLYTHSLLMQPQADPQRNTLEKIKQNAQNVQESIGDIIWSVNPDMDVMEQVIARMRAFGADMTEHAGIVFQFTADGDVGNLSLGMATRKNLYLIYKEVVNNAVKYSIATTINVLMKVEVGAFSMIISDDGVGFDVSAKRSGNGLSNMNRRAEEVGAAITISSKEDKGTTVTLKIPL